LVGKCRFEGGRGDDGRSPGFMDKTFLVSISRAVWEIFQLFCSSLDRPKTLMKVKAFCFLMVLTVVMN
jgi:hypothetical protein